MLLKLAWRNIWRNKRRTFITMASVFFAVLLSVMLKGIKEGTYEKMMENLLGSHMGYIQVQEKSYWDDRTIDNSFFKDEDLVQKIKSVFEVSQVIPRIQTETAVLNAKNELKMCSMVGIDVEQEKLFSKLHTRISQGSYLKEDEEGVLIGKKLAKILNLKVGDDLILSNGQGYHGDILNTILPIKGIFSMGSPDLNERLIYISQTQMDKLLGVQHLITSYQITVADSDITADVATQIQIKVGNKYNVLPWEEMAPELKSMIEGDRGEGIIISGILYLVISFGIFGTILMMLSERAREFGVLVAIGMKRWYLSLVVFIEVLLMSLLGVLVGGLVSYPFLLYFHFNPIRFGEEMAEVYEDLGMEAVLQASIDPNLIINQAIIITVIVFFLSLYPMLKIKKIVVMEAMRS